MYFKGGSLYEMDRKNAVRRRSRPRQVSQQKENQPALGKNKLEYRRNDQTNKLCYNCIKNR